MTDIYRSHDFEELEAARLTDDEHVVAKVVESEGEPREARKSAQAKTKG